MDRTPVSCSELMSVGYDPLMNILELEFKSGAVFRYFKVPKDVHEELMNAPLKAAFYRDEIRGNYGFMRS